MKTLFKKLIVALVLLLSAQTFAANSCSGTYYFKLPDGWKTAYAVGSGRYAAFTESEYKGWLQLDALTLNDVYYISSFSIKEDVDTAKVDSLESSDSTKFDSCKDFGETGELWIQLDGSDNSFSRSSTPPGGKVFHVFLPVDKDWSQSIPMLSVDGKPGEPLLLDMDRCGWYYKRFIGEEPPSSVTIYRDDDEKMKNVIGMSGNWGTNKSDSIDLKLLFEMFASDELYFVADENYVDASNPDAMGWSTTDPVDVSGICHISLDAILYDTDASLHGAFACAPNRKESTNGSDTVKFNACYYPDAPYNIVSQAAEELPCIGVTQGMVMDILDSKTRKPSLTEAGKKCFGSKPDEAFAAMFNSTKGVNEVSCIDVPLIRNLNGAYEFNSDDFQSFGAPVPGGFYPAEVAPDDTNMLSERLPAAENKRKAEGPVFFCSNFGVPESQTPDGLRTIDEKEGVPVNRLICNGPGWDGGIDCDGLFFSGDEFSSNDKLTDVGNGIQKALGVSWNGDGWGWSCPNSAPVGWKFYEDGSETFVGTMQLRGRIPQGYSRWVSGTSDSEVLTSGGRNQHFCMESHATFRYRKGLYFSYLGTDDAWVYIDNKLAVDAGGMHLPAPGYVDLDKFVGTSGSWVIGETYPIDIFSCSRRTTTSTFSINTNIYIQQNSADISLVITNALDGAKDYKVKYSTSNPCDAKLGDDAPVEDFCEYMESQGKKLDYSLVEKNGGVVMTSAEMSQDVVYFGGIDLTDRCDPKIDSRKITGLPPKEYNLVVAYNGVSSTISFKVVTEDEDATSHSYTASNKFGLRIVPAGPLAFDIILDNANKAKTYVVMDLMGGFVTRGNAAAGVTRVAVQNRGVYIVRVGDELQKVNVK